MPVYIYQHPETEETTEVVQKMSECHVYVDSDGTEWERVWSNPNAATDSSIDPFDGDSFVQKTKNKNYKHGEIQEASKEASEKRKQKLGYDPVEKKFFKDYSQRRRGKKHPKDTNIQ
jgi:hypothetical protein